jgi:hypothetical protein
MPADIDTWAPTSVPVPISIHASPNSDPGGNVISDPGPNAANLLAARDPG